MLTDLRKARMMMSDLGEPLLCERRAGRPLRILTVLGVAVAVSAAVALCVATGSSWRYARSALLDTEEPYTGPRLQFTNGCHKDPLWLAGFAVATPMFSSAVKLEAGATHVVPVPDGGLVATRFWAKWGCDETGNECKIGQSGGPGEACSVDGCAPPIDSKL